MSADRLLCESCPLANHVGPTHEVAVEGLSFAHKVALISANLRECFSQIAVTAKRMDRGEDGADQISDCLLQTSALVIEVCNDLDELATTHISLPQTLLTLSKAMLPSDDGRGSVR